MDGILCINKPTGMTSRDVVNIISKILKTKKIGHTGTLDPDVDGVLVLCVGKATKLVEALTSDDKEYVAKVKLGFSTTTEDSSGEIVEQKVVDKNIDLEQINKVLNKLVGEIDQTPPMYSAIKINGKKLYEYARQGIEVERPSRKVTIYDLKVTSDLIYENDCLEFELFAHVGKGTYIRTLAVQIGELLGYPAHMSKLTRTKQGKFSIDQTYTLEDIENGNFEFISISDVLRDKQHVHVNDFIANKVKNGAILNRFEDIVGEVVIYYNNEVIAIYDDYPKNEGKIKPIRVF